MAYPSDGDLTSLATLKAWLTPRPTGGVSSIEVTGGGSGYTSAPTVVIDDPDPKATGARATAVLTADVVTSIEITVPGNGYVAPSVTITGGGGTGATALAHMDVEDALQLLIRDASSAVLDQANIERFYDDGAPVTEVRNGNGQRRMMFRHRPVTAITSVTISGVVIPHSIGPSAGWLFDDSTLYLIGYEFTRGVQNVVIVLRAGESPSLPLASQRAKNAERAAILTASLWWKRRPFEHQTSDAAPQGMGVSMGIVQKDFPAAALSIINNLTIHVPIFE